jgi:hypothetical protein
MAKISVLEKLHAQSKTNAPSSRPKEKPSHSASCTYRLSKDLPISPKTPFRHIQILPGIETPSFCCRRWDQVKRFREELNAFSDPFLRSDPKDNTTSQREPFASHTRVSCARQVARLALSEKSPLKQTPMKQNRKQSRKSQKPSPTVGNTPRTEVLVAAPGIAESSFPTKKQNPSASSLACRRIFSNSLATPVSFQSSNPYGGYHPSSSAV